MFVRAEGDDKFSFAVNDQHHNDEHDELGLIDKLPSDDQSRVGKEPEVETIEVVGVIDRSVRSEDTKETKDDEPY